METRRQKDARGSGDCERGRNEEDPINKCLSRIVGIDESSSDVSYTGFNTGSTRAAGEGLREDARVNPTCKHIDGNFACKHNLACFRSKEQATVNIFRLLHTVTCSDCSPGVVAPGHREASVDCNKLTSKFTEFKVSENHYSEWPVKSRKRNTVCDKSLSNSSVWTHVYNNSITSSAGLKCDGFIHNGTPIVENDISNNADDFDINVNPHSLSDSCKLSVTTEKYSHCSLLTGFDHVAYNSLKIQTRGKETQELSVEPEYAEQKKEGIRSESQRSIITNNWLSNSCQKTVRDKSGLILSVHPVHPACLFFDVADIHSSSTSHTVFGQSLPGTAANMKPAKIGQLTPISYRSRLIDRSDGRSAGIQVLPTAQQAWLCGRDGCAAVVHGEELDGPVIVTKCNVDVVSYGGNTTPPTISATKLRRLTIQGATTLTDSPSETKLSTGDGVCDNYREITGKQFPKLRFQITDVEEQNIDKDLTTKTQSETNGSCSSNIEDTFNVAYGTNKRVGDLLHPQVTGPVYAGTCMIECHSPFRVSIDAETQSKCSNADIAKRGEERDKCENIITNHFYDSQNLSDASGDREDLQVDITDSNLTSALAEMSIKQAGQSVVYANFLTDRNSISSIKERDTRVILSSLNTNQQILAVNPMDFHRNRFSHQYLNSSVTGQNYPDILPGAQGTYPYVFTDSGIVACPILQHNTDMIFTATATKETSFIEKSNPCQPNAVPSSGHHYYNKSSVFPPLIRESSASLDTSSRHCDDKCFINNVFPTNVSNKQDNRDNELDLMFFPKLSELHCPLHRSSPLLSSHIQLQHHQQHNFQQHYEQQQLLSQFHPNYRESQQLQQTQLQQSDRSDVTSAIPLIHYITCGPRRISISPVSLLWTFLSVLVAGTCLLSFLSPYWTIHPDHVHSFGLFNLCVRDQRFSHPRPMCMNFGHQHFYSSIRLRAASSSYNTTEDVQIDTTTVEIAKIPSGAWQAACLLFGAGVCVQVLGALVSLVVLALNEPWHHRVALINGYMQTVGVLLLVSGILLYPVGFSSPFFSYYCDSSRSFCTGHCALGWSYVIAIMSTALSIFCPVMSSFAEAQQIKRKPVDVLATLTA